MALPKMILFDYGETLIHEDGFDGVAGNDALLQYAVKNADHLNGKQIQCFAQKLQQDSLGHVRALNLESHNRIFEHFLFEYLGIEFSLTPLETEIVFWDAAAPGRPMPGIENTLALLDKKGIRTGVISNISFSGEALAERINRLLPENHFEFILASSEYLFRKPCPYLFELALRKANLCASDVWFCGDNAQADVAGAAAVGIRPVWFTAPFECAYRTEGANQTPVCRHDRIVHWSELSLLL